MKSRILFGLLCSVSMMASSPLLAIAQTGTAVQAYNSGTSTVIPQSTALTVAFPANMVIDAKKDQDYPTTLMLAQPLLDSYGNTLAPQGSPVAARVHPVKNGAQIIAESVIIQGRTVPIQATSPILPSRKVTMKSGVEQAQGLSPLGGRIGGGLLGGINGGNFMDFNQGAMLGSGLGAIAGLASEKSIQVVEIPQGSVYVLTLQVPVAVSTPTPVAITTPVQSPAATVAATSSSSPQFRFQTVQEYQSGLDRMLQAYQQRQISQTEALNILKAADAYATTQLSPALYPPTQQRQFIRQVFGFSYAIDSNTSQGNTLSSSPQFLF